MLPRAQLIAIFVAIEFAIVGGMVVALRGDRSNPWFPPVNVGVTASGPHLIEGAAPQVLSAGLRPALTVDIGYADLTIVTRSGPSVDVALSPSTAFGFMRTTAPIAARKEGDTIRIATTQDQPWSIGDDRMVTVTVPPQTQVTVVNAGDITASGLRAPASMESNNGVVRVNDFDAPRLHVETSMTGRIDLNRVVTGRLEAATNRGRVVGTELQVRDGRISSGHGGVKLTFAPGADTLVTEVPGSSSDDDDDAGDAARTVRIGAGDGRLTVHSTGRIEVSPAG